MSDWKEADEWLVREYIASRDVSAAEGSKRYHAFMGSITKDMAISGHRRTWAFVNLRYRYQLHKEGYSCVVVKLVCAPALSDTPAQSRGTHQGRGTRRSRVIVAHLYMRDDKPQFLVASPTTQLSERGFGDTSSYIITFKAFEEGYEKVEKELSVVEIKLLDLISSGEIELHAEAFPSPLSSESEKVVADLRLPLRLAAVAVGQVAAHRASGTWSQPDVARLVSSHADLSTAAGKLAESKYFQLFRTGNLGVLSYSVEQRVQPLLADEALNEFDVRYPVWKELHVARSLSDLVVNGVAPSFPFSGQWTILSGVSAEMFRSPETLKAYAISDLAKVSLESLGVSRPTGAAATDKYDRKLQDMVRSARQQVVLSDAALLHLQEGTGRHFADLLASTILAPYVRTRAMFSKLCFDLFYGLHAAHKQAGIAFGKLERHAGSVYYLANVSRVSKDEKGVKHIEDKIKSPSVAYVAGPGGERDTYVFPYVGMVCTISGAAVAIVACRAHSADTPVAKSVPVESGDGALSEFAKAATAALALAVPEFVQRHKTQLERLCVCDPETAFALLSYENFDQIAKLTVLATTNKANVFVPKGALEAAKEYERICSSAFADALAWVLEGETRQPSADSSGDAHASAHEGARGGSRGKLPPAGDVLLKKMFSEHLYRGETKNDATLCDVFSLGFPLRWSGTSYSTFPPWAKFEEITKRLEPAVLARDVKPIEGIYGTVVRGGAPPDGRAF